MRSRPPGSVAGRDQPEAAQILGGQVDAPVLGVLAHVAQDVRELQRHAEIVGEPFAPATRSVARRVAQAEDRQAQPADRAGDAPAVEDELVEALVA